MLVPPSRPTAPVFVTFNNTLTKIAWNLTNQTADAGPQVLIVNIRDHPLSPISLEPSQTHQFVRTEPGVTYTVTIEAINSDGSATSQPSHLTLPPDSESAVCT
jgi:NaMN:DMB phosphoribosyltransferase